MDKVKVALTLFSIVIIVAPVVVELFIYRDNLLGLVLPPQLQTLANAGNSSNRSQSMQALPDFQLPQPVGQPQYDPNTGVFSYPFNFTNPLNTEISIDQLSAQVCGANNQTLGNISINQPIKIEAGANAIINVTGNLNQTLVNQLIKQYNDGNLSNLGNLSDLSLNNVDVTVAGVAVHIDQIDAGSISQLEALKP